MFKTAAVAVAALFVAASPIAYAQGGSTDKQDRLTAAEPDSVTDLRIAVVKAALQLTPNQEKYWPAIEDAIRTRAKHRATRLENLADRVSGLQDTNPLELALNRNPVDIMHRRADALAQRSDDIKKLGDAWQPLYQALNPDQKRRLALLRIVVLRAAANRLGGGPGMQSYDDEDDD
jgi:LTXXQ motif family protein